MSAVSDYLIKIICAAILCSILNTLVNGSSGVAGMIKTISGIFMVFAILSPLINMKLNLSLDSINGFIQEGNSYSEQGMQLSRDEKNTYIKTSTQSYILEKADVLGAELNVEVVLSGDSENPYKAVYLEGSISPYAKEQLSQMMVSVLGIPKEAQHWTS